jgi:hypothetical protein
MTVKRKKPDSKRRDVGRITHRHAYRDHPFSFPIMSSKSPFSNYLRTNYAPTSEEEVAIKALCTDPLRDIQRLDEEINRLEEEITRLRLKREELQTFVDDHQMLLSPIRQLYPEILQRIFVECVAADCNADWHRYPVMLAAQAPMLLGRVCSSWRRIAYSTPGLWNVLHIAIPNPDKGEADGTLAPLRLEAVKDWLGRTGSLPLYISLFPAAPPAPDIYNYEPPSIIPDYNHIYQYAEALMEFADRWGSLTVYVPLSLLRPWSLLAGRTLPMLKEFRLFRDSWFEHGFRNVNDTDYQVLEFLRQSPLESVTLSLRSRVHIPVFRTDALTYLDIRSGLAFSDGYSLASFISDLISLRTLRFMFASGGPFSMSRERIGGRDRRSDSEVVTLLCLERLDVSGFGDDHCCIVDLWQHLRAPKLHSMTFQLNASKAITTNNQSHGIFARFMDISQCSILSIHYAPAGRTGDNLQSQERYHTALMPYIRACTQVTDLTIGLGSPEYPYTPTFNAGEGLLGELFLEEDDTLLPHLRNLTFA